MERIWVSTTETATATCCSTLVIHTKTMIKLLKRGYVPCWTVKLAYLLNRSRIFFKLDCRPYLMMTTKSRLIFVPQVLISSFQIKHKDPISLSNWYLPLKFLSPRRWGEKDHASNFRFVAQLTFRSSLLVQGRRLHFWVQTLTSRAKQARYLLHAYTRIFLSIIVCRPHQLE